MKTIMKGVGHDLTVIPGQSQCLCGSALRYSEGVPLQTFGGAQHTWLYVVTLHSLMT